MFYVYLLENQTDKSWYIGFTTNIKRRVEEHLSKAGGLYTRKKNALQLIYFEAYIHKLDAVGREKYLKSGAGRRFIKEQLAHYFLPR